MNDLLVIVSTLIGIVNGIFLLAKNIRENKKK